MYFLLYLLLAIIAFSDAFYHRKAYQDLLTFFIVVVLVIFAATRSNVGLDWYAYENMYINQYELVSQNIEIGFASIYRLLDGLSYPWVLMIINILNFTLLICFLDKFSYYKNVALLVFFSDLFFYLNLSGMRQSIALSISLISIFFVVRKQLFFFAITIFIACLFHKTAIVFSLAYIVNYFKVGYRNILIASLCSFIIAGSFLTLSEYLSGLGYFRNVELYTDSAYNSTYSAMDYLLGCIKRVLPVILLLMIVPLRQVRDNIFLKLYLVGMFCYLALYPSFPDIAVRLSLYFLVYDMIIYGLILYNCKHLIQKIAFFSVLLLVTAYKINGYTTMEGYIYHNIL
jgi:hypothetical protein